MQHSRRTNSKYEKTEGFSRSAELDGCVIINYLQHSSNSPQS